MLFKWFFNFLQMLKKTNIVGKLVRTLSNSAENIQHTCIQLTGICLSGNRKTCFKSHLLGNSLISLFAFLMVAIKKLQETCLCTCCTFGTKKLQLRNNIIHIIQIHDQFIEPKSCSLTNSCRLSRLKMCESQCRHISVLHSKIFQFCNNIDQFLSDNVKRFTHNDHICIVANITGCRTQMDNPLCLRALLSVSINMRHDIMTNLFLTLLGYIIINIILSSFQLRNLLICNVKTEFLLCFSQSDPKSSPCLKLHLR